MKLEYTLRFEDWSAFTLYVNRTVPSLARARKISHFGLPLVYFSFGVFAGASLGDWVVGGAMMSLGFAWVFLYPKLAEFRTQKHLRKLERGGAAASILGDYCLETTDAGIDARIANAESSLPWASIVGIVEDAGRAYLQLSPTAAVVVPLDAEGAVEFVQECRQRLS